MTAYKGVKLRNRNISLTEAQNVYLKKLGGAKWIRQQIERAINESANQSSMVSVSDVPMGQEGSSNRIESTRIPKEGLRVQREDNRGLQPQRPDSV